ncbi:MAG: aldehyde dehydrogenase family protein [Polyangia bacterium]
METARPGKVTYVSLSADDPVLNAAFDRGIAEVRERLGQTWPLFIGGQARATAAAFDSVSPTDRRVVVARMSSAAPGDVNDAVAAARAAYPIWCRTPWQERAARLAKAANLIRGRRYELAAWMIFEMGKNRIEALGEIEETADLIDYYNQQMRANDGYVRAMDRLVPTDNNTSVLRPYGVWAVIAPWNFPYALLAAPAAAALLTGNTVVMKPSSETPLSAVLIAQIFAEAGLPPGTVNCLTGSGRVVGDGLARHPDVDGVTFTGSLDVGFNQIYRQFSTRFPKPCIVEMGGKNPAIVMDSADLERAVSGIYRSAFGMNGHKCSACSRLYVHEGVADELLARLDRIIAGTRIGDPLLKETFVGPLATRAGYEDFQRFVAQAGDHVRVGGRVLTEGAFAHGYFVQPTLLQGLPPHHQLMRDELFVPILAVQRVTSLDQALEEANNTPFGLTAGIFTRKQEEIDGFLERIQAGVVYVNRAAGATTGAWPGVQPFGGWKGSGSTGKNIGGLYTLPCYLREQSRTVCE